MIGEGGRGGGSGGKGYAAVFPSPVVCICFCLQVLEAGEIVEFDKPSKLLEDVNGHFTMFAGEADMDEKE